jgi:hypothetical protein
LGFLSPIDLEIMPNAAISKYTRLLFKSFAWIIGVLLALMILLTVLIQVPFVQDFAKDQTVSWLSGKLKTKLSIGKLRIHFPDQILIEKVYFEDQHKDSLLWGNRLSVDIAMFKLLQNRVEIKSIDLDGIGINIKRVGTDTTFNFSFIQKSFASAGNEVKTKADSSKPLFFKLGAITGKNILVKYIDDLEGINTHLSLASIHTEVKEFDIDKSVYAISDLAMESLNVKLDRYQPLIIFKKTASNTVIKTSSALPEVRTGKISLRHTQIKYNDAIAGMHGEMNSAFFLLSMGKMDLNKLILPVEQLTVAKTNLIFSIDPQKKTAIKNTAGQQKNIDTSASNWHITAKNVLFDSNYISFDNNQYQPIKKGVDYQHLLLSSLGLQLDSLDATPQGFQGNVKKLKLIEKSGLQIKELTTKFLYNNKEAKLENLFLQTPQSIIRKKIILKYASLNSMSSKPENISLDANFKKCKISVSDILLFAPMLEKNLQGYQKSIINVNTELKGLLKDLKIPTLELNGLGVTSIKASGSIKGLPQVSKLYADIRIVEFKSSKNDVKSFIPPKILPEFLQIPENLIVRGNFKGTIQEFNTQLKMHSTEGDAFVDLQMKDHGKSYNGNIQLDSFNLGHILTQEKNIGKVSLLAKVVGSGFDYKTMATNIEAELLNASIKKYEYKHLLISLKLDHGEASVVSSIKDPNIEYHLTASSDFGQQYPSLKMDLNIDTIDLKQLHLVNDKISFHGQVFSDFTSTNPDSLEGGLMIRNMHFSYQKKTFSTDSIILKAHNEADYQVLEFNSKPARMLLKGKYQLTELGTALEHSIHQYYEIPGFKDTAFFPQDWIADIHLNTSPLVLRFMPELAGTDTISAHVQYNSSKNDFRLTASAPLVQYDNQFVKKIKLDANTENGQLDYHLSLWKAGNPSFLINATTLDGFIKSNTIHANLIFHDKNLQKNYQVAGTLNESNRGFEIKLHPDSLLLNKQKWVVKPENLIRIDTTGVYAKDFQLKYKDQSIALNSVGNGIGTPLKLEFINFDINTITDVAKKDSMFADGIINGNIIVSDIKSRPTFTSDIKIANLAYQRNVIGNLLVKVDNIGENRFNANLELKGAKNQVSLKGMYQTNDGKMDLHFNADSLDMAILKPFSLNQLKEASGNLKAKIDIDGTFDEPSVKGLLNFENVFMTSSMLGQKFKLDHDEVKIDDTGIHFKDFSLEDSLGNVATLHGSLITKNYRDYEFDLKFDADDFNLINSTQADNKLFFGKLNMDANIRVTGNLEAPIVNAKLKANKNTNLTVVMPGSNPELQSREGVVNFIDRKKLNDSIIQIVINDSIVKHLPFSGLILNTVIETDTAAIFSMVMDSQTGDAITVQGKSSLSAALDESGKLSLTGLYELERGSYQFSLNMIKKRFEIVKGSIITWTGDPLSALVNIKALYKLKASPIDLVEQQLVGQTATEVNKYKQRLPVEVYLKMGAELMKPLISFDIVIPEQEVSKYPLVDDKLQKLRTDESEMNKQVFALLILGRFVGEDLMQNNTGSTTTGTMVRQSVSGVLSSQLNRVAGGLIKGVDLNFDFESQDDYSTGTAQTRTDLKVGMSRTLKNDRIKVNVGTNVPIEGSGNATNTSYISSDVQVDYMLSKDGKYMLRTYSKNKYEGVIEGQIVETGVTFIFTVEYDKFKEIFRKQVTKAEKKGPKKND